MCLRICLFFLFVFSFLHRLTYHFKPISSALTIFSTIVMPSAFISVCALARASSSDSPFSSTTRTRAPPANNSKIALVNSTCENFFPGHTRGPEVHGTKTPGAGDTKADDCQSYVRSSLPIAASLTTPSFSSDLIQRSGRNSRASGPQNLGSLASPATSTLMWDSGGIEMSLPFRLSVSPVPVHRGTAGATGYILSVSYCTVQASQSTVHRCFVSKGPFSTRSPDAYHEC